MIDYTVTTTKTVDEAVNALAESLKKRKFGVLWDLNMTETLRNKGVEFEHPYRILEVCNPQEAKRVLGETLMVGYFLPCKIVVYEKDGMTHIGMPKPTEIMKMIGNERIAETAAKVEAELVAAIQEAKS
ncbi:conserved hypothetical protein [[Clostridium] ultunense Esp]|uniref:DUF302 domain-containing protein n=1 Tax=Thermicanus aegyptius TaxID=94009 RepID=UPI0002B709D6|nr:DUF302 domain-containing protein [Thermicanus aegyptius]CCQ97719.1 conserved hypothetical protein [[Clostridium] ultunense Esp]